MYHNPFLLLKEKAAIDYGSCGFRVILDDEFEYAQAHEISNSHHDLKPRAVAYPRTTVHAQACIAYCIENNEPFRTRSGGHQHEGMSSLKDGLVIRLSDMSLIEYTDDDHNEAWVSSGMKLGTVYNELARYDRIIPAGGCFTVNVGGLTLGGGWGMHSRRYGLTCDSLLAVDLIKANGEVLEVTRESDPALFKALCGAGGGNFGLVTRFKFRLTQIGTNLTMFRFGWNADQRELVAKTWLDVQARFPKELTSFVRMSVTKPGADKTEKDRARDFPIYGGGLFYGSKLDLQSMLGIKDILEKTNPVKEEWAEIKSENDGLDLSGGSEISIVDLFGYDDFTSDLAGGSLDSMSAAGDCVVKPPAANCNVPHPHKVSSAFPKGDGTEYNGKVAKAIAKYLDGSSFDPNVRSYMTFHAMGGAISEEPKPGRAFPYKDKEFLLQFQSWWNYPVDQSSKEGKKCMKQVKEREEDYIQWVINFRQEPKVKELVEGAFINFVDKDLVSDSTTSKGKLELLSYYYAQNLDQLRKVKKRVDPEDRFNFEMSIPPAED